MYLKQMRPDLWRVIVQHNGRRASATAPTRSAAELRGAELLLELGGTPNTTATTIAELLDIHLEHNGYRPTTHADLTRIRQRLPATFLAREVRRVEPVIIDGLYRQLTRDGWTPHRVQKAHTLLSSAFKRAKRLGWCQSIPTRDAELPKPDERTDTTPELADVQRILTEAPDDLRLFLWLASLTGARRGELCALRWEDIDRKAMVLHIRRSVSYTAASGLVVGDVKTGAKGRRRVPINTDDLDRLDTHRAAQTALSPWLFTNDRENPWRPDYATHRFIEHRDNLGLYGVRLHDLRHFVASELIGGITDARTAATHLGHARPSMTTDKYAKTIDARHRAAVDEHRRRILGG